MIRNLKIGTRLTAIFAIIVLINIATLVFTHINLNKIGKESEDLYKVRLISIDKLIEADRDAYQPLFIQVYQSWRLGAPAPSLFPAPSPFPAP